MNVAIIIDNLNGGGAERVAQYLGDYLISNGSKVYYFLLNKSRFDAYTVNGEVVNTNLGAELAGVGSEQLQDVYRIARCGRKLKKYKEKYNIDVSISFMEMCNYLNVASRYNDKIIITIHTTLSARTDYIGTLYKKQNIKRLCYRADKVVAVSEYIRDDLIKNYDVGKERIEVIPNTLFMSGNEDDINWNYGNKAIICVGRLVGVKQQDRIIRAFSYAANKCEDARLVILGEGNNFDYLKYIAEKQGVEKQVIFKGFCLDVCSYYKHSRALVMASMAEGFPNTMVEAMTMGTPIITTDSPGGCGEIVGKNLKSNDIQYCDYGILIPYIKGKAPKGTQLESEEIQLGQAILQILEDDALYRRYHEASLKRAEYYSKERVMKKWDEIIVT